MSLPFSASKFTVKQVCAEASQEEVDPRIEPSGSALTIQSLLYLVVQMFLARSSFIISSTPLQSKSESTYDS